MAAINLATRYEAKIVEKFFSESFLVGKTNQDFDFHGVKSITLNTPKTQPLNNYNRAATADRFGTPTEMEDTIQELTLSQDKSYSITIDKGNLSDQLYIKEAGKMVALQLREQVVPTIDKYGLSVFVKKAGKIFGSAAPTKANIVGLIADALTKLDNNEVPDEGRFIVIGATNYNLLRLSTEVLAADPLAVKALGRGVVGEFMGVPIIKVPASYLGTAYFLVYHKGSVTLVQKLKSMNLHTKAPGIDGAKLEGRHYYDAFVYGTKSGGVYASVPSAEVQAVVTITPTGASHALTSASATGIKYTVDGTDPRYSPTAVVYSSAVTLTSGQTIKAYAYRTSYFDSAVTSALYTA